MKNFLIIGITLLLILISCGDEEEIIPNVKFSGKIYIPGLYENPAIIKYDVNRYQLGIKGIIIYKIDYNHFLAFDLMCPHEKSITCLVKNNGDVICTCPCCNSKFLIATEGGGLIEGPAQWPLKTYNTTVNGDYLIVSN
ncbi:MAG: Rieske 2Fe-2S domain-containing protein [Marinilabiliaceae bacterium]|nr:Rieske 2Fe-2S domain-containing protein [Marinilabiliaceae bacterium]